MLPIPVFLYICKL